MWLYENDVFHAKWLVVGDVIKFSLQCAMLCGVLICVTDMFGWVFSEVVC